METHNNGQSKALATTSGQQMQAAQQWVLSTKKIIARKQQLVEVMEAVMKEGEHYGKVPGTQATYPPAAPQIGRPLHHDTDWPCRWSFVGPRRIRVTWFAFPSGDDTWETRVSEFSVGSEDMACISGDEPDADTLDALERDVLSGAGKWEVA